MIARHALPGVGILLILAACGPKPAPEAAASAPPAVDSAAVRAGVADLWQHWVTADTAGDVAALSAMLDDSVRIDSKGMPPMLGRAATMEMITTMFKTTRYTSARLTPEMTIPISNEMAYETGDYAEGTVTGKKASTDYGRYAAALVKGADGTWRIGYLMAFSDSLVPVKP